MSDQSLSDPAAAPERGIRDSRQPRCAAHARSSARARLSASAAGCRNRAKFEVAPGIHWIRMGCRWAGSIISICGRSMTMTAGPSSIPAWPARRQQGLGGAVRRADGGQAGHPCHRHPLSPRSSRHGRLAVQALERAAGNRPHRISAGAHPDARCPRDTAARGSGFQHPRRLVRNRIAESAPKAWGSFNKIIRPLPAGFKRIKDGDVLTIGARQWHDRDRARPCARTFLPALATMA